MAKSLFSVAVRQAAGAPIVKNVLAQPNATSGEAALCAAIDAALAAAGEGAVLLNAVELNGKPLDASILAAVAPATDGTPRAAYSIQFRPGSGPDGANVGPMAVLANPQTSAGVTISAPDLAIQAAVAAGAAVPSAVTFIGYVDIDATV